MSSKWLSRSDDFRKCQRFPRILAISSTCGQPENPLPSQTWESKLPQGSYKEHLQRLSKQECWKHWELSSTATCWSKLTTFSYTQEVRGASSSIAEGAWEIREVQYQAEPVEDRSLRSHCHLVRTKHQQGYTIQISSTDSWTYLSPRKLLSWRIASLQRMRTSIPDIAKKLWLQFRACWRLSKSTMKSERTNKSFQKN